MFTNHPQNTGTGKSVILWLIGKSKRSTTNAVGTCGQISTTNIDGTGQSNNECDQQQGVANPDGGVNASLLQSNANSVDQMVDQDAEIGDLNLL